MRPVPKVAEGIGDPVQAGGLRFLRRETNMKKLKRKSVAVLTILSFLLTLLPMTAFAATPKAVDISLIAPTVNVDAIVTVTGGPSEAGDEVELLIGGNPYPTPIKQTLGQDLAEDEITSLIFKIPLVKPTDVITAKVTPADSSTPKTSAQAPIVPKPAIPAAPNGVDIGSYHGNGSKAYFTDADGSGVALEANEQSEMTVVFNGPAGQGGFYWGDLYVWAEAAENQPDNRFRISDDGNGNYIINDALGDYNDAARPVADFGPIGVTTLTAGAGNVNVYKIQNIVTDERGVGLTFNVHFTAADKYSVYVSTVDPTDGGANIGAGLNFLREPSKFLAGKDAEATEPETQEEDNPVEEEIKSGKLTFDKKEGLVGDANKVKVQVVDKDGKDLALGENATIEKMTPVITDQSNKDANIDASIGSASEKSLKKDGSAELTLKADKPTKADVKVTIVAKGKKGKEIEYVGTLNYEFKAKEVEKPKAAEFVVMTINSNKVRVDGKTIEIDTEAIIKNDRTFVPFRALLEAFGAQVEYEDGVVTAVLDDQNVEMTLNEKDYKINDKKAVMDVAPFIQDDRTMIPVRFAAEALGFVVTPFYNDDGTTASVEFKRQ